MLRKNLKCRNAWKIENHACASTVSVGHSYNSAQKCNFISHIWVPSMIARKVYSFIHRKIVLQLDLEILLISATTVSKNFSLVLPLNSGFSLLPITFLLVFLPWTHRWPLGDPRRSIPSWPLWRPGPWNCWQRRIPWATWRRKHCMTTSRHRWPWRTKRAAVIAATACFALLK